MDIISLPVPTRKLRDFPFFKVSPSFNNCPSTRCKIAGNSVCSDFDIFRRQIMTHEDIFDITFCFPSYGVPAYTLFCILYPILFNVLCYLCFYFVLFLLPTVGRDISVGIATRYGLDGPGIESRWRRHFSAAVQTGPGAHPASCTMGTGSLSLG
jgi:hypothetical protein